MLVVVLWSEATELRLCLQTAVDGRYRTYVLSIRVYKTVNTQQLESQLDTDFILLIIIYNYRTLLYIYLNNSSTARQYCEVVTTTPTTERD